MQVQTVNGPHGPIGFVTRGRGPAVVLLAGLGASHRIWGELPALLARRFRVIALDNRGVGASRAGRSFTFPRAVDDLQAVLDVLSIPKATLLGASMGGSIALAAAARLPARLTAVVAASCAARLSRHGRRSLELLRTLLCSLPPEEVGRALMSLAFAPPFAERYPEFVAEAERLYGLDEDDVPGALAQVEHLLAGWDLTGDLAGCRVPALLLAGRRDPIVAVEDTIQAAEALPRAETLVLDEAAHSVLAEGGEEVLHAVGGFILRHGE